MPSSKAFFGKKASLSDIPAMETTYLNIYTNYIDNC